MWFWIIGVICCSGCKVKSCNRAAAAGSACSGGATQAHSEGHVSVEHLKRYTTSGMAGHPQPHGHPRWGCVRVAPPAKARPCVSPARSTVWI
ncbi:hypothetical protein [Primorskyibacter flagellatus]|uniref:hypothetical protein n=1 Tax=Primorskyibacter flagellatus TaxID=1387277 RepID=UPI003A8D451E